LLCKQVLQQERLIKLSEEIRLFDCLEFPEYFKNYEAGKIKVVIIKNGNEVKILATGTEKGRDGKKVKVDAKVKPTSFTIEIKN